VVPAWSNVLRATAATLVVNSGAAQNFQLAKVFGNWDSMEKPVAYQPTPLEAAFQPTPSLSDCKNRSKRTAPKAPQTLPAATFGSASGVLTALARLSLMVISTMCESHKSI
jgi:hypothetical protein